MNNKYSQIFAHFILFLGVMLMVIPIWIAFASSTHENVAVLTEGMKWGLGDQLLKNYSEACQDARKAQQLGYDASELIKMVCN